jgi:hypothetical protein
MPLQGKKRPKAATYGGIQNQKGQTRLIESDPFGSAHGSCAVRVEPLEGMGF